MDPITAIGLLGTLANLIQASNCLLEVAKNYREGEKEVQEVFNDVAVFEEALKGFDRVLRSRQTKHNISATVMTNALSEAAITIQKLESKLVQICRSEVSAVRRMKWVQNKSNVNKLHDRLKEQTSMLQSFLALAHAETFLNACQQNPDFLQVRSSSADDTESDTVSISSESTMFSCGSSLSSLRRASVDTASSIGSSSSSLQKMPSNALVGAEISTTIDKPAAGSMNVRKACRYDCFCQCHAQNGPRGKGVPRFSSSEPVCTDANCEAAKQSKQPAVTPSSFFRRAMVQITSSKSLRVRYELNTFRMVSEGSDAMRYVKHGNLDKLKICIESGDATLWDTAPDGWSLLHTAAYNRQLPIVRYLLDLGASTEVADVGARKPADLAILKSLANDATSVEHEIVEVFSKKDDYIFDFEFTPVHVAVLNLYDAEDRERPNLDQLIEVIDDCNNAPAGTDWAKWKMKYRNRSPLFTGIIELFRASAFGKPKTHKVIHNLLDKKDRKYHWTPLHWASSSGQPEKMRTLMRHGANPFILSNLDANILHAAAESKSFGGLDGALEIWKRYPQQLDINQANRWAETPLHVAAWGSLNSVKRLLEAGANRDVRQEDGQVPLHCAGLSRQGEVRRTIVTLLCSGDSDVHINAQDTDDRPPIFDFLDDPICMQTLLEHGARLDLLDTSGRSAFHHACIQGEHEALETLLRFSPPNSVMVTVKDHNGDTALIQALRHRNVRCTMSLLELADVGDIVGEGGWAAVHHAAQWGDAEVLEAVLLHPSFVKGAKTIDGKTAEVVAMEAGNWCGEIKYLLKTHTSIT
ncbi:hypothetical protein ACLMJK_005368 [Lecanora helva]